MKSSCKSSRCLPLVKVNGDRSAPLWLGPSLERTVLSNMTLLAGRRIDVANCSRPAAAYDEIFMHGEARRTSKQAHTHTRTLYDYVVTN